MNMLYKELEEEKEIIGRVMENTGVKISRI